MERLFRRFRSEPITRHIPRLEYGFWQTAAQNIGVKLELTNPAEDLNNARKNVGVSIELPRGVEIEVLQKEVERIQALYD